MTDPGQRNESDPTIVPEQDVDATVGPDDEATVFPDEESVFEAPTVVTGDEVAADLTVFPEEPAGNAEPAAAVVDDEATVFPDESPDDSAATIVADDSDETDDDATVFPDEESRTVLTARMAVSDESDRTVIDDDMAVFPGQLDPAKTTMPLLYPMKSRKRLPLSLLGQSRQHLLLVVQSRTTLGSLETFPNRRMIPIRL